MPRTTKKNSAGKANATADKSSTQKFPFTVTAKLNSLKPLLKEGQKLVVTAIMKGGNGAFYSGKLEGQSFMQAYPIFLFE